MSQEIPSLTSDRRSILKAGAAASAAFLTQSLASAPAEAATGLALGRRQPFDEGWRFYRGEAERLESPTFNDSDWRRVDLPHDWSIEDLPVSAENLSELIGPFSKQAVGGGATGFSVGGEGWYRKGFTLSRPPQGRVEILFEGVYRDSDVWLNGVHLGAEPSGYMPFAYDLTPHLSPDGENLIAVRVRNLGENSRWYSGSGIYRHVWLDVTVERAQIARWGVGATTRRIMDAGAVIEIRTRLERVEKGLTLVSRIRDDAGRIVWEGAAAALPDVMQMANVVAPQLWSPDSPTLYALETELRRESEILDRETTVLGIRIVTFDEAGGMSINGAPTRLRGGCIHHDLGLLGAASFDAAEARKVSLLKARGYNAVRCAHNPFSPGFLLACDRQGLLVIAEAFDAWRAPKLPQDYSIYFDAYWRTDISAMVLSARNHPSIIMWSIGNEIPNRNAPDGIQTQWRLANTVHRLDASRPVTAAINAFAGRLVTADEQTARSGFSGSPDEASAVFLDIVGYNYKHDRYQLDHERFPRRIIYGSESFPKDIFEIWDRIASSPYVLGDFVWTAMDYLGEAGIGGSAYQYPGALDPMGPSSSWPEVLSSCGDIDLIGRQKAASLARDVVWAQSDLEVTVQRPPPPGQVEVVRLWGWSDERPSWTWPGAEGKVVAVRVYTSGDRVDLRVNGRLAQSKTVSASNAKRLEFQLAYAPGKLEVIAFRGDVELARRELVTAGDPFAIRVLPEKETAGAGLGEVSFVGIEVTDEKGRVVRDVVRPLTLSIAGPATVAAFGNANPNANGSFQTMTSRSWDGHALAILRGTGKPGAVKIEVGSAGLKSGYAVLSFS